MFGVSVNQASCMTARCPRFCAFVPLSEFSDGLGNAYSGNADFAVRHVICTAAECGFVDCVGFHVVCSFGITNRGLQRLRRAITSPVLPEMFAPPIPSFVEWVLFAKVDTIQRPLSQ